MWKRNRNQDPSLAKSSPFSLSPWRGDWENAVERFFRDPFFGGVAPMAGRPDWLTPRMNITQSDQDMTVRMEVPGVKAEDVQIDVTGDTLTVRGEKCQSKEENDGGYHYNECEYGSFFRTVELPSGVDPNNVQANIDNGLLTIKLKKSPDAMPKRIPVQGAATGAGRQISTGSKKG